MQEKSKKEVFRAIKFILFSASAGIIQFASFALLQEVIIKDTQNEYGWSYFISLALSVIWNFTFNRKFTFKSANNVPIAMLKVLGYYLVFTPISVFGGEALVTQCGWNEYLVFAISLLVNFVTEFIYDTFVVFGKSIDSANNKEQTTEQTKENE